jgi:hypothetical protein
MNAKFNEMRAMKELYILVHSEEDLANEILTLINSGHKQEVFNHLIVQCRVSYTDLLEHFTPTPANEIPLNNPS